MLFDNELANWAKSFMIIKNSQCDISLFWENYTKDLRVQFNEKTILHYEVTVSSVTCIKAIAGPFNNIIDSNDERTK